MQAMMFTLKHYHLRVRLSVQSQCRCVSCCVVCDPQPVCFCHAMALLCCVSHSLFCVPNCMNCHSLAVLTLCVTQPVVCVQLSWSCCVVCVLLLAVCILQTTMNIDQLFKQSLELSTITLNMLVIVYSSYIHMHTVSSISLALKIAKLCGCTTGMCIQLFEQYVEHCLFLTYITLMQTKNKEA